MKLPIQLEDTWAVIDRFQRHWRVLARSDCVFSVSTSDSSTAGDAARDSEDDGADDQITPQALAPPPSQKWREVTLIRKRNL